MDWVVLRCLRRSTWSSAVISREDFEVDVVVVVVEVRCDSLYITPVEKMMAEVVPAANRISGSIVSNCDDVENNVGDSSIQHGMLSRMELWLSLTMHLVALKAFLESMPFERRCLSEKSSIQSSKLVETHSFWNGP